MPRLLIRPKRPRNTAAAKTSQVTRLRRLLPWLGLHILFWGATACSDSNRPCTIIGCQSQLRVELVFESNLKAGELEVVVEHSGQTFSCQFGAEEAPCQDDLFFAPSATSNNLTIVLQDTPEKLRITASSGGSTETLELEPEYTINQPNGPNCAPTCLSASMRAEFDL